VIEKAVEQHNRYLRVKRMMTEAYAAGFEKSFPTRTQAALDANHERQPALKDYPQETLYAGRNKT
jgi:hypothetical protein